MLKLLLLKIKQWQTKEANIIEVVFEINSNNKDELLTKLNQRFTNVECSLKNLNTIKILSHDKIDISPIVTFLSSENIFITEAKLIKPTLEDAFVKMTGIEINLIKKEKEKK